MACLVLILLYLHIRYGDLLPGLNISDGLENQQLQT
jgi:hypothetical protein